MAGDDLPPAWRGQMSPEERFWRRVPRSEGCWEWRGARHPRLGYGKFSVSRNTNIPAHRAAWLFEHGEIPQGMRVLHKCDNPPCVRPDHLFLGTQTDNMRDCAAKGRIRGFIRGPAAGRA